MLPVETFAEVVSFLGYYDLGGIKLASKVSSAAANRCAGAIRVFDFSDFSFIIRNSWIAVYRYDALERRTWITWICTIEFASEVALAEFVSEAFRNCTVGSIEMLAHRKHAVNAVVFIAKVTAVAGTLALPDDYFEKKQNRLYFVDGFRRVDRCITLGEPKIIRILSERKNIVLHI
ncbi:hypothetical protein AAVH_17416 [Aphelenchoides avenae]|nr:hypothetical protein AAVH_17416 [Aphelenchus avenae]